MRTSTVNTATLCHFHKFMSGVAPNFGPWAQLYSSPLQEIKGKEKQHVFIKLNMWLVDMHLRVKRLTVNKV